MWNYEEFTAKAQLYFSRAADHTSADSATALWLLLGLEFLLRAPLAKQHPMLLAESNSIMHAAGFPQASGAKDPHSIKTSTVRDRLKIMVTDYATVDDAAQDLTELRNSELHSSTHALDIPEERWLPKFVRVVDVLCRHLALDPDDVVGGDLMRHGRGLAENEDKKLQNTINKRIEQAKAFYDTLTPEQIAAVTPPRPKGLFGAFLDSWLEEDSPASTISRDVDCPACPAQAVETFQLVRSTPERVVDDELVRDVVYLATDLTCPVCQLQLIGTAEIRAAGLNQQRTLRVRNSFPGSDFEDYEPDFGDE